MPLLPTMPQIRITQIIFAWSVGSLLLAFAPGVHAQVVASWQGGAGNWSDATNWQCFDPAAHHCVPNGAQWIINLNSGAVKVDANFSVHSVQGGPTSSLNLNGTALSVASDVAVQSLQLSNQAFIATPVLDSYSLNMQNSDIFGTANTGIATISGSTLQTLTANLSFALASSTVNDGAYLQVGNGGPSTISGSTINGAGLFVQGNLTIDSSQINVDEAAGLPGSFFISGGAATNGSQIALTNGPAQVFLIDAGGSFTLAGQGSSLMSQAKIDVGTGGFGIGGIGSLTLQDGALLSAQSVVVGEAAGVGIISVGSGAAPSLSAQDLTLGNAGQGTLVQINGTVTVGGTLTLGVATGVGNYHLVGGSLSAASEVIGQSGNSQFTQDGGMHNVTGPLGLTLGQNSGGVGVYVLSAGSLTVKGTELIGSGGNGEFDQFGGTNTTNGLGLGGATGNGIYLLKGGTLTAAIEQIGSGVGGNSVFTQTGGANNVQGRFTLGAGGGYNLAGGTLTAGFGVEIDDGGAFVFTKGQVNGDMIVNPHGTLQIAGSGSASDLIINGNVLVGGELMLNGSVTLQGSLKVFGSGAIVDPLGDPSALLVDLIGDFIDQSTQSQSWNTTSAGLEFSGGGPHLFDLAGHDGGGFSGNFGWGTLTIDPGNTLSLGFGSGDALYVNQIVGLLVQGNTVTNIDGSPGIFLYYNLADNPGLSGMYQLTGGGELIPFQSSVPEPPARLLTAAGLGIAIWMRRRFERRTR